MHEHGRPSVLAVVNGEYFERTGAQIRRLRCGDVLRRTSGHQHANEFAADCTILLAMIDPEASAWAGDTVFNRDGTALGRCRTGLSRRIAQSIMCGGPLDLLHVENAVISEMLTCRSVDGSERAVSSPPRWLSVLLEHIHDNPGRVVIADLASKYGLHPSHLTRVFRRWRGCTVSQYIQRLAAQRAAIDLRSTSTPIAGVAIRHGFSDQPHLTRAFKSVFGTTPAKYRSAHDSFKTTVGSLLA